MDSEIQLDLALFQIMNFWGFKTIQNYYETLIIHIL